MKQKDVLSSPAAGGGSVSALRSGVIMQVARSSPRELNLSCCPSSLQPHCIIKVNFKMIIKLLVILNLICDVLYAVYTSLHVAVWLHVHAVPMHYVQLLYYILVIEL